MEKSKIMALVTKAQLPCRRALDQLGLPESTYYRWLRKQVEGRLQNRKGDSPTLWNKPKHEKEKGILARAGASPELSSQQLVLRMVDTEGWCVSETTF